MKNKEDIIELLAYFQSSDENLLGFGEIVFTKASATYKKINNIDNKQV